MNKPAFAILLGISLALSPDVVAAKSLFHATSKAAAKKIAQKGFSLKMMNPKARFGKGIYVSNTKAGALMEKPRSETVMRFKATKMLKKNTVKVNRMSNKEMKAFSHDRDLRGNLRRGVPGGDLAKKMGAKAGAQGKAIQYPSSKGKV